MENALIFWLILAILTSGFSCFEIINERGSDDDRNVTSFSDAVTYSVIGNFSLVKCHCVANHALKNGSCVPVQTVIEIYHESGPIQAVSTSDFSEVIVNEVICANPSVSPEVISNILLTENNTLLHLESKNNFTDFCVEHVEDETGEVVLQAHVCPPKKPLFKCHCSSDHVWDNGNCLPMNTTVQLIKWVPYQQWEEPTSNYDQIIVGEPTCHNSSMNLQTILDVVLYENNNLFHLQTGNEFTQYCVENVKSAAGEVLFEARVCLPVFRVPSCCQFSEFLDHSTYTCYPDDAMEVDFHPPFKIGSDTKIEPYLQPLPKCSVNVIDHYGRSFLDNTQNYLEHRHSDGVVYLSEKKFPPIIIDAPLFCVAMEIHNGSILYSVVFWDEYLPKECDLIDKYKCHEIMEWLLLPLVSISTLSLFVILVLHSLMPELRKSIGNKNMICHVISLFFGFCFLVLRYINYGFNCKIIVPMVQMSFLAAFFWLNVICFDLWWKLSGCINTPANAGRSSKCRFKWYSIYAWGSPLLIGIITIIMDNIPSLDGLPGVVVPGFANQSPCWFHDKQAAFLYYFMIIALLMAVNVVFFFWVLIVMIKANCSYQKVLRQNKKTNRRTVVYLKVFSVMGITWICETLSWVEGTCEYWAVTDVINSLRGVTLLFIFFGNKASLNKIIERLCTLNQSLCSIVNRFVNSLKNLTSEPSTTGTDTNTVSKQALELHSELRNRVLREDTECASSKSDQRLYTSMTVITEIDADTAMSQISATGSSKNLK